MCNSMVQLYHLPPEVTQIISQFIPYVGIQVFLLSQAVISHYINDPIQTTELYLLNFPMSTPLELIFFQ